MKEIRELNKYFIIVGVISYYIYMIRNSFINVNKKVVKSCKNDKGLYLKLLWYNRFLFERLIDTCQKNVKSCKKRTVWVDFYPVFGYIKVVNDPNVGIAKGECAQFTVKTIYPPVIYKIFKLKSILVYNLLQRFVYQLVSHNTKKASGQQHRNTILC